jgi:transposase
MRPERPQTGAWRTKTKHIYDKSRAKITGSPHRQWMQPKILIIRGALKHFRAVATRYDKRDDNYLACVKLASIRIWMRFNESMA